MSEHPFAGFSAEQQAILVQEMRRPDKKLLLKTLRNSSGKIGTTPELLHVKSIFNPEEELKSLYDDLIWKIEKLTENEVALLFSQLPICSDLE